jgi:hypothetical protein
MRRLAAAVVLLLVPACGAVEERQTSEPVVMQRYGITLEVPAGWDVELTRGAVYAASFDVHAREPTAGLPADGVSLHLFEADPAADSPPLELELYPARTRPPALAESDFRPPEPDAQRVEGVARRSFSLAGRPFDLFAYSGSLPPPPDALARLNELLTSLAVEPGDFYPGTVAPAEFTLREGWNVNTSGPKPIRADGEWLTAWASTIPYRDPWNALPPHETLEALPDDGVVIWVGLERNSRFPPTAPDREGIVPPVEPPFRIADLEHYRHWEGQVDDIPEYRLWGTVRRQYRIDLRLYFGRPEPTPAMLDEAQAMLDGLRLPDWGPWELDS